ncbi:ferredoxin [Candidatus Roizmanbacteria bacterium CG22_combo_CG10-13_8_21_14_all_38_20]|uniref:Ferredoxin n=1 Tax=Candidatus Roizmanbacteria bacterium CG22_combo_CG10-13_8_21_14_all_38_20 TaxID=1974862 RepID=A0A2H0BVM5_9BACT|nr:ferredoxin [Candidatus Microgenomates bacterium]PIP61654.1 MAG: ferredoxin [Candidatus Roizmanbacteria bacterium CG22_combo_CG10-13_8_21_14_all_38_20]PJC30992.1 MAG: ferredoxin [Candidatus Roizmanbacteria bacterium CG_4_9_14_0_2_um_filter_38_17]
MSDTQTKQVGDLSVTVDRSLCIGAASCVAVAPFAFELDDQAIAIILDSAGQESSDTLLDAARSCPVDAIIITDKNGKQLHP